MITDQDIARINELYHKMKTEGLTPEEKEEQSMLRQNYIASIRANMRAQLDSIKVQKPDGSLESLADKAKENRLKKKKYAN